MLELVEFGLLSILVLVIQLAPLFMILLIILFNVLFGILLGSTSYSGGYSVGEHAIQWRIAFESK
jgi:hypothetical protein